MILRFRASRGTERQQLRWVAAGAAIAVLGVTVPLGDLRGTWVDPLVILCVPVTGAVAVLRYRLWDLDRLVSRTVTYAVVTALLIIPYLLVVPTASKLVEGSGSLAVAAATLTVAALFQPLRRRVQDLVDRRFNRRRYDAAGTVEAFAAGCATRSTWTPCMASCSPWSTTPSSQPRPPSGCAPRPVRRPTSAADAARTATPGRRGRA